MKKKLTLSKKTLKNLKLKLKLVSERKVAPAVYIPGPDSPSNTHSCL